MITKVTLRLRFLDDNSPTLILKTTVPFSTSTKAFFSSFGNKKNVKTGMRGGGGVAWVKGDKSPLFPTRWALIAIHMSACGKTL